MLQHSVMPEISEILKSYMPDYNFWCKLDKWSFKQAALLLHELDPFRFESIRFNMSAFPENPDLNDTYKTFLILKKTKLGESSHSLHPKDFIKIAFEKKLYICPNFMEAIKNEHLLENMTESKKENVTITETTGNTGNTETNKNLTTRERHTLLKALGLMTRILTKHSPKFKIKDRPNTSQILLALLEEAERLNINPDGLKSVDRKLTEALELLEEETQ